MGNIEIQGDMLNRFIGLSMEMDEEFEQSHLACKKLIDFLNSRDIEWSGDAKDAFLSYLELAEKYHKDLKKAYLKQTEAFKKLEENIESYKKSSNVTGVKNL